nr:MAG TPA: hypothetical protein [Caudoviricetes sp.]
MPFFSKYSLISKFVSNFVTSFLNILGIYHHTTPIFLCCQWVFKINLKIIVIYDLQNQNNVVLFT